MALHVFCAAGTYVLGRQAARGFPDAAALTLARGVGASALLLALTGSLIPRPRFRPADWLRVAGLGVLLVPLNHYPFLQGLRDTVPGHPAVIYAMTPVGVLLLQSALARQRPAATKALGVVVALAGVLVLLRPWERGPEFAQIRRGDLWILFGLVVWIVITVVSRPLMRAYDPRTVTAWSLLLGTCSMAPMGLPPLLRTDIEAVPADAWTGLGYLCVVTSAVMMLVWNRLLRDLEPVEVAICANAQPAATALLVWTLGDPQDLGPLYWGGTLLVIAGVVLVQRSPRVSPRPPAPPV